MNDEPKRDEIVDEKPTDDLKVDNEEEKKGEQGCKFGV